MKVFETIEKFVEYALHEKQKPTFCSGVRCIGPHFIEENNIYLEAKSFWENVRVLAYRNVCWDKDLSVYGGFSNAYTGVGDLLWEKEISRTTTPD